MKNDLRGLKLIAVVLLALVVTTLNVDDVVADVFSDAGRNSLRLMSYNIRNGKGMDNETNLDRIVDAINRCLPDVVALQEVDSVTGRSGGVDVARANRGRRH
ncbi:metallophosphoesterase [gut metagenome]|uniref:Metallophosphoesterase n=1 Tax=gut metagenome TaxID=749906 RepID=J9G963_9ZZZZ